MPVVYSPNSFGHWSGLTYNAVLHVAFPEGWPHGVPASDLRVPNPFPMLPGNEHNPEQVMGRVSMRISLPNRRQEQAGDLALSVLTHVSTDQLGVQRNRAPTGEELKALRAAWWSIRDAALSEYDSHSEHSEFLDMEEAVAAFARVEPLFLAPRWKITPERPGYSTVLISLPQPAAAAAPTAQASASPTAPQPPVAPPLPVMPSSLPTASERPDATPFQRDLQEAITDAERSLSGIGNGYAWAVETVLGHLAGALEQHVPGFSFDDYRFGPRHRDDADGDDEDGDDEEETLPDFPEGVLRDGILYEQDDLLDGDADEDFFGDGDGEPPTR